MSYTKEYLAALPIRQPIIEEASLLRELEHSAFPQPYSSPVKSWGYEIRQTPLRTDIITLGDRPIGLCYVRMVWPNRFNQLETPVGEISLLAVAPDYQKMGIGERLFRAGITKLLEHDSGSIILQTAVDNYPMQRLAEKVGFAHDRKLPDYYAQGQHALQYLLGSRSALSG